MRKILAILLPCALLLSACAGAEDGSNGGSSAGATSLDAVKVTQAGAGKAPKVEFDTPLELPKTTAKVLKEGEGAGAQDGQWIRYRMAGFDATTGTQSSETYTAAGAQTLPVDNSLKSGDPDLYNALKGVKTGSEVAYYYKAPAAGNASAPAQHPQLVVLTVEDVKNKPVKASAAEVAELDKAGKLPKITLDAKGVPSVKLPEGNQAPDNLVVQVLEEGTGKTATAQSTVKAKYAGWNWGKGKEFDSSYSRGEAAEFPLNQVIEGWTKGLTGLKQGSKVMLSIPAEMAYASGQGDAIGDLVFYVDLTEVK
ncbi:FKBP-type peptidyl-prolyl cis-trans isomerase [Arthrobacter sp. I2-34]|uniref:Peptidyl-prolyl cis-trans isomerase n=1 Tax=Arthrobacter hankyongi TaxID=2904801 RepID=A0ABS9L688_9MICC|nr:FKBP-type peptidyl-prolyl cis-trans isomerase [Arthrobacter hankyongi]MCG2622145.1 FKBP-type peptidyl-prolyl cis-trans isomerase [Arthrobacter hankyongi]